MKYEKTPWQELNIKVDANGLVPAIIQDIQTQKVLMLAYLNEPAWQKTMETGLITFFSRSKQRLWTKGESSGNHLRLAAWSLDCDGDTFLMQVMPLGPVCHTGSDTCWGEANQMPFTLKTLEGIVLSRKENPVWQSYTGSLFTKGISKIAQKVGEEAVETVIEAMQDNREAFIGETADLLFHLLVLLAAKEVTLNDVEALLEARNRK